MRSAEFGMRDGTDRLRALNVPQQVDVELDAAWQPGVVRTRLNPHDERRVEAIGEVWRIDDEWWRVPIHRRYVEVIFEGGKRVVLFEDLVAKEWWIQQPA
jgi:hypothetical protein